MSAKHLFKCTFCGEELSTQSRVSHLQRCDGANDAREIRYGYSQRSTIDAECQRFLGSTQ